MANGYTRLSHKQLMRAASLKGRIEALERELESVLGSPSTGAESGAGRPARQAGKRRVMSAAVRARISAGQKARWAKRKQGKGANSQ